MSNKKGEKRHDGSLNGLRQSWEAKKAETLDAVRKAIASLRSSDVPITLRRISEKTKEFTASGLCVSESTVLRNTACYELYALEVLPSKTQKSGKRILAGRLKDSPTEIEMRRMHYLQRSSKLELIALLIATERQLTSANTANNALREKLLLDELGTLS
jgi:hypothetical protein